MMMLMKKSYRYCEDPNVFIVIKVKLGGLRDETAGEDNSFSRDS